MAPYKTPDNLVELLNGVVGAAVRTSFYASRLPKTPSIGCLDDFAEMPITSIGAYRSQRLRDVLAEPSRVEWIAGRYRGQSASEVAVAEGPDEGMYRYDLFTDAVKQHVSLQAGLTCAVVTSPPRRYFAAEIATILIRAGVSSHLLVDHGRPNVGRLLDRLEPDILVLLADRPTEDALPPSARLCVTFRRSHRLSRVPQLDVYVVDELGFLGQSTDLNVYGMNRDVYYFERSTRGNLIVTALHNRVQPMLRIETEDSARVLSDGYVELGDLSADS